jgi:hypothetical protein
MTKIFDYILIACAIVAGAVLFAFGTRTIYKRAKSQRMTRFLLYVSIVLVFLGGKFGACRVATAEEPPPADAKAILPVFKYPVDDRPEWIAMRQLWEHIPTLAAMDMAKEGVDKEMADVEKTLAGLDTLMKEGLVAQETADFLKSEANELLRKALGMAPPEADPVKSAWAQIIEDSAAFKAMNAQPHSWVLKIAYEDMVEQLTNIKDIPLAARLKTLNMKREDYKAALVTMMDALQNGFNTIPLMETDIMLRRPPIDDVPGPRLMYGIEPKIREPRQEPKYGVQPRPPREEQPGLKYTPTPELLELQRIFQQDRHLAVAEATEGVMLKKALAEDWIKLEKGAKFAVTDLIDHEKEGDVKIVLKDTRYAELKGDFILTPWEYEFQIPEALAKEIDGLIVKLGDADEKIRDAATKRLTEIAYIALPKLKEALKSENEQVRRLAQQIIETALLE